MSTFAHGAVGKREQDFTQLMPLRIIGYSPQLLAKLANLMKQDFDPLSDFPDPEENVLVPAGYTYFGQFIDHDITFDSTSSLIPDNQAAKPTNLRTPRLDLDCLYGDGPASQPYLYEPDGVKLLPTDPGATDLERNRHGRAIIGDKRNDENSIVSQVQLAFLKYHNAVVDELKTSDPASWNTPQDLFTSARNEVRWTYQKLIVEDFLPRIICKDVLADLRGCSPEERKCRYALYTEDKRGNLPREFVAAAYRFGHSMVRTGYRMNGGLGNRFDIFPPSNDFKEAAGDRSLLGFDPVPAYQMIDNWGRFFSDQPHGDGPASPEVRTRPDNETDLAAEQPGVRLQLAYKIDPTIVDPLAVLPRVAVAGSGTTTEAIQRISPETLPDAADPHPPVTPRPSLALLNLLRGDSYRIASGQVFAAHLKHLGHACQSLRRDQLAVRRSTPNGFKFFPIDRPDETGMDQGLAPLADDTPLWFYVLAEAQAPVLDALVQKYGDAEIPEDELLNGLGTSTQLGWVGGRIVAEVFYGMLDSDQESYVNSAPAGWQPILAGDGQVIVRNLLKLAEPGKA
ncbi:MAG: hypothetical protein ER33_02600 [Cyanobium sp. CACIAM 14]|nr:MAG: hypothetical protein ER33_02600 [Cyanobium sp. CACIAM 14]